MVLLLFYRSALCSHSFGATIDFEANVIATVLPSTVLISGSCYHYFGIVSLFAANHIATVVP